MYYFLAIPLVLLIGCAKQISTCFDLGENANVHGDFGYFYDSATINLNGPAHFYRIGADQTTNPCLN